LKFWENGEREKGFQIVCSAFNEDPDNKVVLDSILRMGSWLKKTDEVERSLREYLKYHPADIDSLIILAETLFDMRRLDQAEEELQKVSLFDPENQKAADLKEAIKKESGAMVEGR